MGFGSLGDIGLSEAKKGLWDVGARPASPGGSSELGGIRLVRFEGLGELEADLAALGPKLARRLLRRALNEAAAPVWARARALVPVSESGSHGHLPGHLWRHVKHFRARARGKASMSVGVGVLAPASDKDAPYYGPFIEWGFLLGARRIWQGKWRRRAYRAEVTRLLGPRGARQLKRSEVGRVKNQARDLVPARPFIARAFDERWRRAAETIEQHVREELDELWVGNQRATGYAGIPS